MKIYSKAGDKGQTSLLNGKKVSKNDGLIHFLGEADELVSRLGLVKAMLDNDDGGITRNSQNSRVFIEGIQKNIFKMMSYVSDSANGEYFFTEDEVSVLEKEIDILSEKIPKQTKFVIPGKNILEAQIHLARTSARKAERLFTAVSEKQRLCPNAAAYLNRLSDYLFVLSQQ